MLSRGQTEDHPCCIVLDLLKSADLCNGEVYKERVTVVKARCDQCLDC